MSGMVALATPDRRLRRNVIFMQETVANTPLYGAVALMGILTMKRLPVTRTKKRQSKMIVFFAFTP